MNTSGLHIDIQEKTFHFKQPAGTSRGVYTERHCFYLTLTDTSRPGIYGRGECAPLPGLSCDDVPHYSRTLAEACRLYCHTGNIPYDMLRPYPSILFGIESAVTQLNAHGSAALFDTPFARGGQGITINGLVWMGTFEEMEQRMEEKLNAGFRCVKLKIGAIDFAQEMELIRRIRQRFGPERVELRVDANGAFSPEEAPEKMEQLSRYALHSIEQPIRKGQWADMARLCRESPLPIALDEELIGVNDPAMKAALLDYIRPQHIVLKPSLHGGMKGTTEWIELARQRNIGSWITSALESNVGLNAVAQLAAHIYGNKQETAQGLGTGMLFTDNTPMPIAIRGEKLWFEPQLDTFLTEWNSPSPTMTVNTSGSTGKPKAICVEKKRMEASAQTTCRFLGLKQGQTALLCMDTKYIAGKMMIVRALSCGLRLVCTPPSGRPLRNISGQIDFAAMVPLQVAHSLEYAEDREKLRSIGQLIIGGGAIDEKLEQELRDFPNAVWSTYGMTETLSHIALRRLSGKDASSWYEPFEGISVETDSTGRLIIRAPQLLDGQLATNDLAELHPDGRKFRILGRTDNTICSGGVKIQIEEAERLLRPHLHSPFLISKRKDTALGETVVMLHTATMDTAQARDICRQILPHYWQPRHYVCVEKMPLTPTGKPDRAAAEKKAAGTDG